MVRAGPGNPDPVPHCTPAPAIKDEVERHGYGGRDSGFTDHDNLKYGENRFVAHFISFPRTDPITVQFLKRNARACITVRFSDPVTPVLILMSCAELTAHIPLLNGGLSLLGNAVG
jgi:hypothetical protein